MTTMTRNYKRWKPTREARLGLWAASNPLPPWEWRKAVHAAPARLVHRSASRSEARSHARKRGERSVLKSVTLAFDSTSA